MPLLTIMLFSLSFPAGAQGTWTWMHGSNLPNSAATFGTQFIPAPANNPPGMYKPYGWTDQQGNFWVYGGYNSINFQTYSDLWKFDPLSNQWTWMNGTGALNSPGVYGTQGVPSPLNHPGGRFRGWSWVDNSGNLWLFGGFGFDVNGNQGRLNDLWKFDVLTSEWTWVKGPNTINTPGSYGTLQVPSLTNNPDPRDEGAAAWTDNAGDLWFYGGQTSAGYFSDMWKYHIATNTWTWMSGANTLNVLANHGTLNVQSAANTPGGRAVYARWTDSNGIFWMFGGIFSGSTYDDMWSFDPAANQWTWRGGPSGLNDPGNYGNYCEANNYAPSGRTETLCTWRDSCDRLWMMGGNQNGLLNQAMNDMWFFDPAVNQFTLVGGSQAVNQPGNFGTILVPAASNYPPSNCGSLGFTDLSGNFWLFCGLLNPVGDNMNAIWKYQRPQACPTFVFSITPSSPNGCAPLPISFTLAPGGPNFVYDWDFGDPSTLADTSHAVNPSYTYSSPGTYTVSLIITNTQACNTFIDTVTTVISVSSIPQTTLGSDTTICGPFNLTLNAGISGASYAWSTGDTLQSISVSIPGTYSVAVVQNGCPGSDSITISNFLAPDLGNDTAFCNGQALTLNAGLWDTWLWNTNAQTQAISVSSSGTYWVEVFNSPCTFRDSIDITVNPLPVVNLGPDTLLCPGEIYTIDAGNPGATYAWSTGSSAQTITTGEAGYFNVVVTANNCDAVDNVTISYYPDLDLGPDLAFCDDNSISITAGPPGFQYLWNTGDTASTIEVSGAGEYSVLLNNGTCVLHDTIEVSGAPGLGLLFVPNAFTPNKNGLNDEFRAYGDGIIYYHLMIFDRWGQLVFETEDINEGWNGLVGGAPKPFSDVYVYRIIYRTECSGEQEIEKIGHVNLLR